MLTGYADGAPENTFGFHEGIDIWVDGKGGQDVVVHAERQSAFQERRISGRVGNRRGRLGGGVTEWDRYLHVGSLEAGFAIDDTIDAGTKLGVISTTFYNEGSRHLHVSVLRLRRRMRLPDPNNRAKSVSAFRRAADRDPLGKTPKLLDINGDDKSFLITKSGDPRRSPSRQSAARWISSPTASTR